MLHVIYTQDDKSPNLRAARAYFELFLTSILDMNIDVCISLGGREHLPAIREDVESRRRTGHSSTIWLMQFDTMDFSAETQEHRSAVYRLPIGDCGRVIKGLHPNFNEGPVEAMVNGMLDHLHSHYTYSDPLYWSIKKYNGVRALKKSEELRAQARIADDYIRQIHDLAPILEYKTILREVIEG